MEEEKPRITRWHITTVALLGLGYSAYYFCRSDYSVALPLILAEQVKRGIPASIAQIRLGSIASFGVLAYAIGKFPSGGLADIFGGKRNFLGGMAGSISSSPSSSCLAEASRCSPSRGSAIASLQSLGWAGLVKVTSRWFSFSTYGTVMAILSLSYLFGGRRLPRVDVRPPRTLHGMARPLPRRALACSPRSSSPASSFFASRPKASTSPRSKRIR